MLGIDETTQPFSTTTVLPFSILVLQCDSRLGEGKAARGWYEYLVSLRFDQSLRGVADRIDAFFFDIALVAGYSRGRTTLHADGNYLLIALLSSSGLNGEKKGWSMTCGR